ncbi:hypothetical protein Tsubulata_026708 [Turnera subulata]|uniref:peroxidase n=1 Tax=Turnera subulata TaxID=218843 RepID=A0A9Q0G6H7_9ROSI|nr:hypothetical protein Tsubulata_026708 [Turnera subulata]
MADRKETKHETARNEETPRPALSLRNPKIEAEGKHNHIPAFLQRLKAGPPNLTLKGFDKIESIKDELEKVCPGVVSCADVLALATRDGILLEALSDIPSPNHNISQILSLFQRRGFNERDTGRIMWVESAVTSSGIALATSVAQAIQTALSL